MDVPKQQNLYKSRHAGLSVKIRSEVTRRHPSTGDVIGVTAGVWANFGEPTGLARVNNPLTGQTEMVETFRGGYFNLDAVADDQGWDDDLRERAKYVLDKLCVDQPDKCQRVDYIVPPAEKPWPTYDEQDAAAIVEMAAMAGLTQKAIAYERENENREDLIALLEGKQAAKPDPAPERKKTGPELPSKAKPEPPTPVVLSV